MLNDNKQKKELKAHGFFQLYFVKFRLIMMEVDHLAGCMCCIFCFADTLGN